MRQARPAPDTLIPPFEKGGLGGIFFRCLLLVGVLLLATAAAGQEPERPEEEIVDEILALERRIEALLRELSPAAREDLDRRRDQPAAPADATDATAVEPAYEPLTRHRRRPACNTLAALDENGDGRISAADRYWRYVYLWVDRDGDRRWTESEIASAFELGVREIATSLETFVRVKGGLGEMRLGEYAMLDLRGDGFGDRRRTDDGALVLDAGSLRRGDGPQLLSATGEPLTGLEPLRAGLKLRLADGQTLDLNCP